MCARESRPVQVYENTAQAPS
eukprot:COSAG01_NODE_59734_length_298_cov_1.552764_2_plen_20_part_01